MSQDTPATYLTAKDLATRYAVSVNSIWRWSREGDFPKPVKIATQCTRWKLADLESWESAREVA